MSLSHDNHDRGAVNAQLDPSGAASVLKALRRILRVPEGESITIVARTLIDKLDEHERQSR